MSCLVPRIINGKTYIQFNPSTQMYGFAMARCQPANLSKKDAEVCELINLSPTTISRWRSEYDPHFTEWLENFILRNSSQPLLKKMLEDVGNQKALEGEFPFWKAMALKHGVIQPDQATLNVVPVNLATYDKWSPEELEHYRDTLLSATRSLENKEGPGMAEVVADEGPEGNPA